MGWEARLTKTHIREQDCHVFGKANAYDDKVAVPVGMISCQAVTFLTHFPFPV